ncbi:MAG: hypothetical protein FRX49_09371 [Trebouxia sp. A1-2]|nr:MAG: hypothetical protein FRX49_09371 [Trebouxia sp. A1-2]
MDQETNLSRHDGSMHGISLEVQLLDVGLLYGIPAWLAGQELAGGLVDPLQKLLPSPLPEQGSSKKKPVGNHSSQTQLLHVLEPQAQQQREQEHVERQTGQHMPFPLAQLELRRWPDDADLKGGLASRHEPWGPRVLGWAQLG